MILISPSAVLLVIMDDLREIRNHLIPNHKSEDEAGNSSYKIIPQYRLCGVGGSFPLLT